jgi:hypothetical protein
LEVKKKGFHAEGSHITAVTHKYVKLITTPRNKKQKNENRRKIGSKNLCVSGGRVLRVNKAPINKRFSQRFSLMVFPFAHPLSLFHLLSLSLAILAEREHENYFTKNQLLFLMNCDAFVKRIYFSFFLFTYFSHYIPPLSHLHHHEIFQSIKKFNFEKKSPKQIFTTITAGLKMFILKRRKKQSEN